MLVVIAKSLVSGYTRKDGVVVKPHSDKRVKRAAPDASQLVLFPAPAKTPVPPSPFKGLDPVKSTGDLFADHAPATPKRGVEVRPGKGLIKDKYLAEHDGEGVPGGPWNTPQEAEAAAHAHAEHKARRAREEQSKADLKAALRARLRDGGEPTDVDLQLVGLRAGSSDLKWFIPAAADLFGIPSRRVRPHIEKMIRVGHTDMGAKRESVPTKKALQAVAIGMQGT